MDVCCIVCGHNECRVAFPLQHLLGSSSELALWCSLAQCSAKLLWDSKGQRWQSITAACAKEITDGARPAETRQAAAATLAACMAAAWVAASEQDPQHDKSRAAVAQHLADGMADKLVFAPVAKACASEDRCAFAAVVCKGCCARRVHFVMTVQSNGQQ